MEAPPSLHPTDQTLSAYGLGKLDDGSAEAVNAHLEECPDCRARVAAMSSDSFLDRARDAQQGPRRSTSGQTRDGETRGPRRPVSASSSLDALPPELAEHPDYQVVRELGRGGMGVVYLARNRLMGRDEVLKVMGRNIMERPGILDRFLREIRSVARLRHPNIVTAYAAFRLGDSIAFSMEYVDGFDLAKLVKTKGALPVGHTAFVVHQAALGLQHAHEEGMVHRDIKPGNLMLARKGDRAVVKVLDFGLARATREQSVDGALTHVGQMLGTPDYIAPEQTLDAQRADIRADIYSLGCTLYYMLTGRPPFRGTSLYDILQAHHSIDATPLNLVRPDVPVELAAVVAKMMAKEPERRFQTPKEVAQALAPFFKKGAAGPRPEAPASLSVSAPVAPASGPPAPPPADGHAPEVRWESLVQDKVSERSRTPAPAPAPGPESEAMSELPDTPAPSRRPPGVSRRVALAGAAGFLGLVALGVVITIRIDRGDPSKVVEVRMEKVEPPRERPGPVPSSDRQARVAAGSWTVEGDELVQSDDLAGAAIAFGDPSWSDYDLTLEAKRVTGPGHGIQIVFHAQPPNTYGWFGLGVFENKGCEMYFCVRGKGSREGETNKDNWKWEKIDQDRWYPIKIKVRKGQFECFLDESRLFRESFYALTHGRISLRTGEAQARFRRIKVTAPDGKVLWEGLPDPASFTPLTILQADGNESKGWFGDLSSWSWNPRTRELIYDKGHFAGALYSGQSYKDFELRCRIRSAPDTNSGIFFHRGRKGDAAQCEIAGTSTGSLYFQATNLQRSPRDVIATILKPNDFNEYNVRCVGKHVTIRVNGAVTVDGDFPTIPDEGQLGFESSWVSPMTIRDLQITDLGATPVEVKENAPAP